MRFLLISSLYFLVVTKADASGNGTSDAIVVESQFFWTMMTMSAVLLGVGVLLYIHACLTKIRDEEKFIIYEASPLMGPKIPPPPSYEQVI